MSVYGIALSHAPCTWKSQGGENGTGQTASACPRSSEAVHRASSARSSSGTAVLTRAQHSAAQRWQIWIGTKSRLLKLKTQRFGLDHKSRKLNCLLCYLYLPTGQTQRPPVLPPPAIRGARRPCPRVARSTVQWIGTTLGRPLRRTRDAGVCPPRPSPPAAAGPTRCGQVTCAAVLAQPRARLRDPPFTSSASPRARVRRRAVTTAFTDDTELWATGALRLQVSGSMTHAQS